MHCEGCQQNCCKTQHLTLSEKDLDYFLSKEPDLKYIKFGAFVALDQPCPFFKEKEGKCSIYERRPVACRIFPFNYRMQLFQSCPNWQEITREDFLGTVKLIKAEVRRIADLGLNDPDNLHKFSEAINSWR